MSDDVAGYMARAAVKLVTNAGLPVAPVFEGLPFDERSLERARKIRWDDYCELVERVETTVGGPDAFAELVEASYATTFPARLRSITGSFVSPKVLLRFMFQTVNPVAYPNTDFSCTELPDGRIRVACRIHAGARASLPLMRGTIPALRNVPAHLGLPLAEVEVEELTPSVCVALVRMPASRTLVARMRRRVRTDLLDLLSSFAAESRASSEAARRHADRLAQVAALGRELGRCEDLPALGESIVAMLAAAGYSHAALYAGDELVTSKSRHADRVVPLALADRAIGRVEVGGNGDAELLTDLLPWLAIAVDKARIAHAPARTQAARLAAVRDSLTRKQLEVLELAVIGMSNKEIAAELACAENTVEYHVTRLLRRFGVDNRLRLIARFWAD